MKEWIEVQKEENKLFISKKKDYIYEFIKLNENSNVVSKGLVNLKSYLINPILIEINQKKKLCDSVDYVSSVFDQHGFSRYVSKEKRFESKEDSKKFIEFLKSES